MIHNAPITFQTTDGQTITVRRMLPADVNQLMLIYRHLSEESLYQRFREPVANLSPMRVLEEARALAETGYKRGKGFLAFAQTPDQSRIPVAGARYIRTDKNMAEASITIRDDFQRKGIGAQLLNILIEEAQKDGIAVIVANVSANNRGVMKLLSNLPYPQTREHYGSEIIIQFDISQKPVTWPVAPGRTATAPNLKQHPQPMRNAKNAMVVQGERK